MSRSTTTRWGALLAAGTLSISLAACGGDAEVDEPGTGEAAQDSAPAAPGEDDGAAESAAPAPEETGSDEEAQTGAAPQDSEAPAASAGEEVAVSDLLERLKSPGEETLSSFEMSMDLAASGQQMTMDGAVDLGGETPGMDMSMEVTGVGALELILVEGTAYMSLPGVTGEGEWVKVPAAQLEQLGAADLTSSVDVESTWEGWEIGAQSVTYVGAEDVGGEQMDHYQVVVDAAAAAEALGQDPAGMPAQITYDLWVDEQDLMRKMSFEVQGGIVEMTIDNWGGDVAVQAPDPSSLVEVPGLTGPTGGDEG